MTKMHIYKVLKINVNKLANIIYWHDLIIIQNGNAKDTIVPQYET